MGQLLENEKIHVLHIIYFCKCIIHVWKDEQWTVKRVYYFQGVGLREVEYMLESFYFYFIDLARRLFIISLYSIPNKNVTYNRAEK